MTFAQFIDPSAEGFYPARDFQSHSPAGDFCRKLGFTQQEIKVQPGALPRMSGSLAKQNTLSDIIAYLRDPKKLTWLVLGLVWCRVTLAHCLTFPTLAAIDLSLSGPAALVCAETLRQEGFTDRIVMCSMDKHPPYDRPKLSKVCTESLQHTKQWGGDRPPPGLRYPITPMCLSLYPITRCQT